jgi:hypothetical protein
MLQQHYVYLREKSVEIVVVALSLSRGKSRGFWWGTQLISVRSLLVEHVSF